MFWLISELQKTNVSLNKDFSHTALRRNANCFSLADDLIAKFSVHENVKQRLLIVDDGIPAEFIHSAQEYLQGFGQEAVVIRFLTNENTKNLELLLLILNEIEKFGVPRRGNPVLALGGGVLLDTVGLAVSMYRRGVPYIKIPTTLLSLVDTAVGIKTSVNHFERRNRIGSFYPALGAAISPVFLKTLPQEQFSYGLAEIIKIAIVKSKALFYLLEENGLVSGVFSWMDLCFWSSWPTIGFL